MTGIRAEGGDGPVVMVEVARRSDVGRRRTHNEDRDLVVPPVLVVADGLGGQKAGEVAASIAVEAVGKTLPEPTPASLRASVEEANRTIRRMAGRSPERAGMGTTLTAALLLDGRVAVAHVGDSRAYLLRDGELRRLTEDHSVVEEMLRRGDLSAEDAQRHPQRNVITRALGAEPVVKVDLTETETRPGDVLLLCSDGLSSLVSDSEITRILLRGGDLDATAGALTAAANEAGGLDNITVVLARVGVGPQAELIPSERPKSGDTAPHPLVPAGSPTVIGETPPDLRRGPEAMPRTSVLEQVRPRQRRGRVPLVSALVLLLVTAAATLWVGSRSYYVDEAANGRVSVYHGLPFQFAGLDGSGEWVQVDLASTSVRAAEPSALRGRVMGKGEAALLAGRLLWRYGTPVVR